MLPAVLALGVGAVANASDIQERTDVKGLIGIEVGYMGTDFKENTGNYDINDNPIIEQKSSSSPALGLKLGAESKHYRAFVEGRIWSTDEYDNGTTFGGALQYLIPLSDIFNIFIGVNGGVINTHNSEWDMYAGGDGGVNFEVTDNFGIEVGGRYSGVNVNSDEMGKVNNFYQGYVSAIFKFTGDY